MSLVSTILIYSLTILTSSIAFYIAGQGRYKLTRRLGFFFAIAITVIIAGIRYSIGTDYFSYIHGFDQIKNGFNVRWAGLEFGFYYLNLVLAKTGFGAQSIMFAGSLITMLFISKALIMKKDVISVGFGAFVFMLLFYQSSFNMIRLMIAVSIFLYNISNIENRKLLKFLLFSFLAASFHVSVLATIPLYWVLPLQKNSKKKYLLFTAVCLLLIFFNPILERILAVINLDSISYYKQYIGYSNKSIDIAIKKTILYLPILIPGAFMYKKCLEQYKNFYIYYALTLLGVIISALGTFQVVYVDRIAQYFLIASVIVVPIYMRVFLKNKNYLIFAMITILYLILFWVYIYFIVKDHATVPYLWII